MCKWNWLHYVQSGIREFSAVYVFIMILTISCWEILSCQSILLRVISRYTMENGSMRCKIVARWILVVPIYESVISRIKAFPPILFVIPSPPPSTLNIMLVKHCNYYHHSIVPFRDKLLFFLPSKTQKKKQ